MTVTRWKRVVAVANKDTGLAVVVSLLFPGAGQLYNEQWMKGIGVIAAFMLSVVLIPVGIGLILAPVVFIYAVWDAYAVADHGGGWP